MFIFSKIGLFINTFLKVFLYFILMFLNFLRNILIWIIIDRFSPNDLSMVMVIQGIIAYIILLIKGKKLDYLYLISSIIYLILIIGVSIHSEIIIINKFGLNEYTKKGFGKKGDEDVELTRKTTNSSFNDESFIEENINNNRKSSTNEMMCQPNNQKDINPIEKKLSFKEDIINSSFDENYDD